jgi:hypothetical protein
MSAMVRSNQGTGDGTRQYAIPEIGNYEFELIAVSEPKQEIRTFNGKEKEVTRISLDWHPTDPDIEWIADDEVEIRSKEFVRTFANLTLGNAQKPSTLRPFVEALLGSQGQELDDELEYDLQDLVGTRINASVKHYQKANGTFGADLVGPIPIKPKSTNGRRRVATPSAINNEAEHGEASSEGPGW